MCFSIIFSLNIHTRYVLPMPILVLYWAIFIYVEFLSTYFQLKIMVHYLWTGLGRLRCRIWETCHITCDVFFLFMDKHYCNITFQLNLKEQCTFRLYVGIDSSLNICAHFHFPLYFWYTFLSIYFPRYFWYTFARKPVSWYIDHWQHVHNLTRFFGYYLTIIYQFLLI